MGTTAGSEDPIGAGPVQLANTYTVAPTRAGGAQ